MNPSNVKYLAYYQRKKLETYNSVTKNEPVENLKKNTQTQSLSLKNTNTHVK